MALEFASKHEEFTNFKTFEMELAGRPLVVETGKMCGLSNGSCLVRYGETVVLCNVTMSEKPRDTFEMELAGRPLVVETGKMCGLSNGSCLVRYGETVVLCNVTMSEKPRDGIDFFPLSVDFEEKLYAVGRIPGSFMRREGRPGEKAILTSRVVDRPIRPLFPKTMRNDVCVTMTQRRVRDHDRDERGSGLQP